MNGFGPPLGKEVNFRRFALRVIASETLEEKLDLPRDGLTDDSPGPAICFLRPGRPQRLCIVAGDEARVPSIDGMADPAQRPRILHALANHELQAAELFAWALLAFPDAPAEFRAGLVRLAAEEQRHCRMYIARMAQFGMQMGDLPVSGYFWGKIRGLTTPLRFVCAVGLTFENANLDHTTEYARAARASGDRATAALFEQVHRDEIEHVRFGWRWLVEWKDEAQSAWDAYSANVTWPLRGALARGPRFYPEGRLAAGLDPSFVQSLAEAERDFSSPAASDPRN